MTIYRERLWPTAWIFISSALVIPACLLVFLPINATAGVVSAIVTYSLIVVILIATSPVLEVTDDGLNAGRARVPLEFVGTVSAFDGDEATLERGRRLDARAWLMIRGWIKPVVKVELTDIHDPTPYWILSTRRPDAVIAAIATARTPA